jgi:cytochrome c biogenesis protein CcmG, thiol:disulfide interchange protein DsbE
MDSRGIKMQKPPSIQRFAVPIILLAFVAALGYGLTKPAAVNTSSLQGKPAPDFTLKTLEGTALTLSSFKGRPVVVNFFASWCGPCVDEAPMLAQAAIDAAPKKTVFLGVAYSDKAPLAKGFRDKYNLGFPVVMDDDKLESGRSSVKYAITGVPETFFINASGVVVKAVTGPLDAQSLQDGLKGIGAL